ncbi:MAG TPA: hypothetical protein PK911_05085 [Candidatus Saccharibacteria bacterium]|nr:hypothetical protein [Candidatus Saccharibacteria bacterium]
MATYIKKGAGDAGLAILVGLIVGLAAASLLPPQSRTQPASAATAFSHEDCQYPNRWSNPVDGCDNSDPAVPECTKVWDTQKAEQDCIAAFVKAHDAPIAEPVTTTPATETPTPNTCGGK